jgi:CRP/FNR family transcriptional regulator
MYAIVNDRSPDENRPARSPRQPGGAGPEPRRSSDPVKDVRLSRGQTLFFDGDAAASFFEIVSGTVRCCRLIQDGRRQIYRFAGAGDMLGLAGDATYGYTAEAVTDVVVRRRSLAGLDAALATDAGLRRQVLQALRDELAATRTQMMLLGRMSAAEKLASFLLARSVQASRAEKCIELPMTRSDIADYLGLTIETVSRKLNEFHASGVVCLETPSRIRITDPGRIEAIAEAA